jgi:hypothetical protein
MGGDADIMAMQPRENSSNQHCPDAAVDTTACSLPSSSSTRLQGLSLPSRVVNPEEEGVLRDILEELDRERTRRAELEAQIRVLTEASKNVPNDDGEIVKKAIGVPEYATNGNAAAAKVNAGNKDEEAVAATAAAASRHKLLALEEQIQGLHQLVDALTSGKPALSRLPSSSSAHDGDKSSTPSGAAAAATAATLPLHALRLLEIIPWEAHEHIFGTEVLYEWQFMVDPDRQIWRSQLRNFPFASNLPVVAPESASANAAADVANPDKTLRSSKDRSLLEFLAGSSSGTSTSKADPPVRNKRLLGTFTDEHLSCTYNLEAGYALPAEGTWEWIGGWRVVVKKRSAAAAAAATASATAAAASKAAIADDHSATTHLDCDAEGWSYASDPLHFLQSPDLVWDSPFDHQHHLDLDHADDGHAALRFEPPGNAPKADESVVRKFRRRKWIRRRMLVDYPFASERTRQYLKVLKENARLSVSLDKVSTQLVETKTRLTETEAELMKTKSELLVKDALLLRSSVHNNSSVDELHNGPSSGGSSTGLKSAVLGSVEGGNKVLHDILSSKNDMGSKLSQWMHSTTARKGSEDLSTASHDPTAAVNVAAGGDSVVDGTSEAENVNGSIDRGGDRDRGGPPARGDELSDSQHSRFDWKKLGRGTLLERLAKGPHRASDSSTIATVRSSGSASIIPEEDMEGEA